MASPVLLVRGVSSASHITCESESDIKITVVRMNLEDRMTAVRGSLRLWLGTSNAEPCPTLACLFGLC